MTARLRPLCADWPEDLFNAMIDRLTDITLRYEGRDTAMYDRRSTDLLVSELKAVLEKSETARKADDGPNTGGMAVSLLLPIVIELVAKLPTRV